MKFNWKKFGVLLLYTVLLAIAGNMIVGLLFSIAQMLFGALMNYQTLSIVLLVCMLLTPVVIALPFCWELKDGKTLDTVSKKKT